MSDRREIALRILGALVILVAVAVTVTAQRTTGYGPLTAMLVALAALLAVLWTYNRRCR